MDEKIIKILIIEDNPGDARLILEMLKESGAKQFVLEHAVCLSSGLERLARVNYDVVLLDLGLPESQGLPTLEKTLALSLKAPIVVLTGSIADENVGIKAVQRGAQDYLIKGIIDGKMLARSIRYAIERKQIGEELKKQRDHLEHLTHQLAAANKELESFSYSVSHDLRAPLNRIIGFSDILLRDYADKLDEHGKNYLQRVINASQHMAQLIKDMLNLARTTQTEMHHETVNLSALAKMVARELREKQPERQVEFVIAEGLVVRGDPRLMQTALENLLSNAWKFTGKCPDTRIEFGVTQRNEKSVYFVRDNGVGFDMAFAKKLFSPFQRLHAKAEFDGTGIGLATVQRIIHRHGGHIWAEGAVDKGATFYFMI
ncbi:MAG: ATP-binding protein [Candidatus Brocadia sp.]|nr:ATP-binding protein [Candidatus Brocadia sp.]